MADRAEVGGVRIAELVATLSYAADLGLGQPMEHCLRQTVIAMRVADLVAAGDHDREATYYLGLLMNVYCHADAAEQARWFGDDLSRKGDLFELLGMGTAQTISFLLRRIGSHGGGVERARRIATFPLAGQRQVVTFLETHSTLGAQFADRIGLGDAVCLAIGQAYEQWDGKGHLRGEEICLPARLVQLAGPVEVFSRRQGVEAARRIVRKHRAGPCSTRQYRTCSASTRGSCWTAWTRPRAGTPCSTPSPRWLAGSRDRTWTTSCGRWPTWSI